MGSRAKRWGNILYWAVGSLLSIATPATAEILAADVHRIVLQIYKVAITVDPSLQF